MKTIYQIRNPTRNFARSNALLIDCFWCTLAFWLDVESFVVGVSERESYLQIQERPWFKAFCYVIIFEQAPISVHDELIRLGWLRVSWRLRFCWFRHAFPFPEFQIHHTKWIWFSQAKLLIHTEIHPLHIHNIQFTAWTLCVCVCVSYVWGV